MGDHKPVFLSFNMALGGDPSVMLTPGDKISNENISDDVTEREMPPSIESPSYTNLLDNSLYTRLEF